MASIFSQKPAGCPSGRVVVDLTDQAGVDAVVACASESFGGVDILVNNAGMTSVSDGYASGAVDGRSLDHWHASLDRILTTSFLMIRAVAGLMQAAGYGRIVNVSSVSGPSPLTPATLPTTRRRPALSD